MVLLSNALKAQANAANVAIFDQFLLPALKGMLHLALKGDPSPHTPLYRDVYDAVLCSYLRRYVGSKPGPHTDWARKPRGCGSHYCPELDSFLTDKNNSVGSLKFVEHIRKHYLQRLYSSPHKTEVVKRSSPHELVVTKGDDWKEALRDWEQRTATAKKKFEDIGEQSLRDILGDQYAKMVELVDLRAGNVETHDNLTQGVGQKRPRDREPLGDIQQPPRKETDVNANKKSNIEVIDLSEDTE